MTQSQPQSPPLLVQFGAGNIGRSLVGQLFAAAGWRVVFLDVVGEVIAALNQRRSYAVTVKDDVLPGFPDRIEVGNVSGINLVDDRARAVEIVSRADLAGTSVGAANLPSACGIIADALKTRDRPLPVMLCENLHGAAAIARRRLGEAMPGDGEAAGRVFFIEAAISKMVPATPPEVARADPLAVWAEAYNTLYLDADAYPGVPPPVAGVAWRRNFPAYVDRKLLLHNFGHAAAAYHGSLAGADYIWECMDNPVVAAETRGCMMETARALAVRYPETFTFDENRAWADDLLRRFRNRALADPVERVGRDLGRKLAPEDRCIGAVRLMEEAGLDSTHTARAVAAALLFCPRTDKPLEGDVEVVEQARERGPESVLAGLCGLDPEREGGIIERIAGEYYSLRACP